MITGIFLVTKVTVRLTTELNEHIGNIVRVKIVSVQRFIRIDKSVWSRKWSGWWSKLRPTFPYFLDPSHTYQFLPGRDVSNVRIFIPILNITEDSIITRKVPRSAIAHVLIISDH